MRFSLVLAGLLSCTTLLAGEKCEHKDKAQEQVSASQLTGSEEQMIDFASLQGLEQVRTAGRGQIEELKNGVQIIWAQYPLNKLKAKYIIFLAGPTPNYFSKEPDESWRRQFVDFIAKQKDLNSDYAFVLPEPKSKNWGAVDNPTLSLPQKIQRQLAWEHTMFEAAQERGFIGIYGYARWQAEELLYDSQSANIFYTGKLRLRDGKPIPGNAAPTTRFEIGTYLSSTSVVFIPASSQSMEWASYHSSLAGAYQAKESHDFFTTIYKRAKDLDLKAKKRAKIGFYGSAIGLVASLGFLWHVIHMPHLDHVPAR